jgi:hypothetical protein
MKKYNGILTKIKHFHEIFDKRSYDTFKKVITWILYLKDWKQWDLANFWEKSLCQIQYFFSKSQWNFKLLNDLRIQWIRNKIWWAKDKVSDILIFDWSIFTKNKSSKFWWLTDYFFSNKDKKVVNWIELFWASIYTKSGFKYVLDLSIFKKWNEKRENYSKINHAWRKFMMKVIKQSKSWLIVLDSGFKWANMCKWIFQILKRHFLVRIWEWQKIIDTNGDEYKISKLLLKSTAIHYTNWRMWVFKKVFLKSWKIKWVNIPVNIIVFHKNGPKKPSVVATSADLEDVYEKMVRNEWDASWKEKIRDLNEKNVKKLSIRNMLDGTYLCFVYLYSKRWSIEECFKELKSYLCFEDFRVQSYEAIMKYLHIALLVHTLLYITLFTLIQNKKSYKYIYEYLKEKRNIKNDRWKITMMWLKLFIEMMYQNWFIWKIKRKKTIFLKNILKYSISLKSISFVKIEETCCVIWKSF